MEGELITIAGMKVCIAEKPSVAKDIAQVIGAKQRKDGYFEGNGYQVTWTFGHFCTLKEPHDYSPQWKAWRLSDLPMIPPNFGIKLIDNAGVAKQFKIIEQLVSNCSEVINCGDAGQEGELIQRWVLLKARCKVPVKRLWISSLTDQAIKEGFSQLKDGNLYDNLYAAGSARAIGDWLLGMNATRLFTKKFGQGKVVLSIGRVQTPTLAMIVQRQKEINAFVSADYWELKTLYRDFEFTANIDRILKHERAIKGLEYLEQNPDFEITSFEKKDGKEGNPRLFDLTGLQVEANKKFGYTAEDTLKYVQSLYEKKLVTYPRVDTTYLSEDLHPKIPGILEKMHYYKELTASVLEKPIPKLKVIFDDKKVSDHHAIIPTEIIPGGIGNEEKRIYDLIARRFIAVFYPECKISNTTVLGMVGKVEFKATGKQILEPGWRSVYAKDAKIKKDEDDSNGDNEEKVMPVFVVGEKGPHKPRIHQGKTTPPKAFTEATLLRAMETAGKQVDNEEVRELLKENGIGRPSTRANIIETLIKRKYIEKKKKNLFATQTGMDLIDTIENELLKSSELTGQWERKLRLIEKGEYALDTFKAELIDMVTQLTNEVKTNNYRAISIAEEAAPEQKAVKKKKETAIKTVSQKEPKEEINILNLSCPKCKTAQLKKGSMAYGCSNFKVCGFKIPFEFLTKKLTDKNIYDLVIKGKTTKIKGFKGIDALKEMEGKLILDENFNLNLDHNKLE